MSFPHNMSGPTHYREAEWHVMSTASAHDEGDHTAATWALRAAQVHATLALAAAAAVSSALTAPPTGSAPSLEEATR